MKANRRGFLGLLGIGAVSAPLAAKAAADAEMAKLIMPSPGNMANGAYLASSGPGPSMSEGEYVSPYIHANSYIKVWGKLPDFVDNNLRERAKTVYNLDADIACKRSWSLAAKIHEQRQRNYKREVDKYTHTGKYELAQSSFKKLTGWEWPW